LNTLFLFFFYCIVYTIEHVHRHTNANNGPASTALAALSAYSATSDIKYSVGISSAARTAGSGSIYIQVSYGPSYAWVGIGIGRQMDGSSMFVVYTDGTGNVTVSPRNGIGHSEPSYDSAARVTLLGGSKADAQGVVANFRYEVAVGELGLESTSAPWIAGWIKGSALNTTNLQTTLRQHDATRTFSLDMKTADVGNLTNPFLATALAANSTGGSTVVGAGDNGGVTVGQTQSTIESYRKAHGALMGVAWVVLLPLGAIIMRLGFTGWWVHAAVQGLGLAAIIAGFGVGYELSEATDLVCISVLASKHLPPCYVVALRVVE